MPAAAGYDVNNGCAGFSTALATADHAIRDEAAQHALVIGVEEDERRDRLDRPVHLRPARRRRGCGCAERRQSPTPGVRRRARPRLARGSGRSRGDPIQATGIRIQLSDAWRPQFRQQGQTVFRWATSAMAPVAREACRRAGIEPRDLGAIVTHQANLRIIEAIVRQLDAPNAVVARDVVHSGNTSAASIPLAFAKLVESGEVASGAPVLLLGFGGGVVLGQPGRRLPMTTPEKPDPRHHARREPPRPQLSPRTAASPQTAAPPPNQQPHPERPGGPAAGGATGAGLDDLVPGGPAGPTDLPTGGRRAPPHTPPGAR